MNIRSLVLWLRYQIDLVLQNLVGLWAAESLAAHVVFPPIDMLLFLNRVQLSWVAMHIMQ